MTEPNPFDEWERQLSTSTPTQPTTPFSSPRLTPAEEREVMKLLALARSGALPTLNNYAYSLTMRYNFDRWELMIMELSRRLKEAPPPQ